MKKILCCGDSWTRGWGIDSKNTWTSLISDVKMFNVAQSGASNFEIMDQVISNLNSNYDILIIGWSGVTRYHYKDHKFDFCWSADFKHRNHFFKNKSLKDIETDFLQMNEQINAMCKNKGIKLIKFSVFGDLKYLWDGHYTDNSFLDFLSIKQGCKFTYDIPFFEYDFLSAVNLKNTRAFAKKYFPRHWEKAVIERNNVRPGQYFLSCGHPNELGHLAWAEYIEKYI